MRAFILRMSEVLDVMTWGRFLMRITYLERASQRTMTTGRHLPTVRFTGSACDSVIVLVSK